MYKHIRTGLAVTVGVVAGLAGLPATASAAPQHQVAFGHQTVLSKRVSCQTRIATGPSSTSRAEARCRGMNFFATYYVTAGCSNHRYVTGGPYAVPHFGAWSAWRGVSCGRYRVAWMNASL